MLLLCSTTLKVTRFLKGVWGERCSEFNSEITSAANLCNKEIPAMMFTWQRSKLKSGSVFRARSRGKDDSWTTFAVARGLSYFAMPPVNVLRAIRTHCVMGAFTPASGAVRLWSDHPRGVLKSDANSTLFSLTTQGLVTGRATAGEGSQRCCCSSLSK